MGTRVSYPVELNIRNYTQLKTWMRWYRNGEIHRLHQPVGKQYTYLNKENADVAIKYADQVIRAI